MHPRTIYFFIDGVGLGPEDPETNPLFRGHCPVLADLLREKAVPVDATLDMPGLPQSATGQTTLFTGINGARANGRHKEGYPGPTLKEVIRNQNLFDLLQGRGYTCTFANAYYLESITPEQLRKRQSVTTVMTLKALNSVRQMEELERGEAIYNDLVRNRLKQQGYGGDMITPTEAAEHLVSIAGEYDLTLFEYFMTDLMAHKGTADDVAEVLTHIDEFLAALLPFAEEEGNLLLITSDHGNLEDATTRSHTLNPVPLIALGAGAEALRSRVTKLEDVFEALVGLYPAGEPSSA